MRHIFVVLAVFLVSCGNLETEKKTSRKKGKEIDQKETLGFSLIDCVDLRKLLKQWNNVERKLTNQLHSKLKELGNKKDELLHSGLRSTETIRSLHADIFKLEAEIAQIEHQLEQLKKRKPPTPRSNGKNPTCREEPAEESETVAPPQPANPFEAAEPSEEPHTPEVGTGTMVQDEEGSWVERGQEYFYEPSGSEEWAAAVVAAAGAGYRMCVRATPLGAAASICYMTYQDPVEYAWEDYSLEQQ